jgi:hypothetical protein
VLTVVLPTRNRPDLLARAVASIPDRTQISVVVSENSGPGPLRDTITEHCHSLEIPVIAPPANLRMVDHWEWALGRALELSDPSHITFLTDRMVYRPHAIEYLLGAIDSFPDSVICFNHDRVDDSAPRVRLQLQPSTFQAYRTDPRAILELCAAAQPAQWVIPRMLNSIAPVELIHQLKQRNGHVFGGISPDYYFGYQTLATVDDYVSLDLPLLVHSALSRSNGHSFSTGTMSPATKDFMAFEGGLAFATPFPDIVTITNAELHDYVVVARETGSPRFPEIDAARLFRQLAREIDEMDPGPFREDMMRRLRRYSPPDGAERAADEHRHGARRTLTAFLYQATVPKIPAEKVPAPLRLPMIALGGYYEQSSAALEAALSLSVRTDPADATRWPPGSRPCEPEQRFAPWSRGGHALRA